MGVLLPVFCNNADKIPTSVIYITLHNNAFASELNNKPHPS